MSHFARFLTLSSHSTMVANTGMSTYEVCAVETDGDIDLMLQCISTQFEETKAADAANMNSWLLVICGALVFFMQAGFAMLCAGCVRKKNVQNTMLKNLLDACGAAIAFYVTGFAFAFGAPRGGGSGVSFIGVKNFLYMGDIDPSFWFFEYAFSATSVTIVAGTLAERCQMAAYLSYSLFLTGFVYPVAARALWSENGFLSPFAEDPFGVVGVIDFAGSGVVHLTGGMTALIAATLLGPRKGRFTDDRGRPLDKPKEFPGHSIALQLMGTMILWFGCK
jgi:Amt family ammonium transporter